MVIGAFVLLSTTNLAILDAVFLTNRVNRTSLTQNDLKFYYCLDNRDNRLSPMVGLSYKF